MTKARAGEDMVPLECSRITDGNGKWYDHFAKTFWQTLMNLNIHLQI